MLRWILLFLLFTINTYADSKVGIMGSFLYNVAEVEDVNGVEVNDDSDSGFGIGVRALLPLNDRLYLRTGAGLVKKNISYSVGGSDADVSFTYLNIPATLYLGGEKVGLFGGTALNARMNDSCDGNGVFSSCDVKDAKTLVLPAIIGFDFNVSQHVSMEFSYEYGLMEAAEKIKVSSAVFSLIYNM
jgi:opacity protein-like surface antigen